MHPLVVDERDTPVVCAIVMGVGGVFAIIWSLAYSVKHQLHTVCETMQN